MSRIGRKPIDIPNGVTVDIKPDLIWVKGPKGELSLPIHPKVSVLQRQQQVLVEVNHPEDKQEKALWGLSRSLISNMVKGVTEGFIRVLEINGVGYKANVSGKKLILNLGYSHPIEMEVPPALEVRIEKNQITISGTDKQKVGQFAAEVRSTRPPEPYKGKGIKYLDEVIRRKAGKVVKAVGAGK